MRENYSPPQLRRGGCAVNKKMLLIIDQHHPVRSK